MSEFDLQLRRTHARLAQIAQHPRSDEPHDKAQDHQHDEQLDKREAAVAVAPPALLLSVVPGVLFQVQVHHNSRSFMLNSAVITEMISHAISMATRIIIAGPRMLVRRDKARSSRPS